MLLVVPSMSVRTASTPLTIVMRRLHIWGRPRRCRHPCNPQPSRRARSEEHTSELQSLMRISYAVFCLKKKKTTDDICITNYNTHQTCKITKTEYTPTHTIDVD